MFVSFCRRAMLLALLFCANAQAGIVINTTRLIYPAQDKEVSFGVHNTGAGEILVQSWLEPGAGRTDSAPLPFIITPALARLPGDGKQLLRVIYAGAQMPQDRESVLWLNVQEIPQAAADNALQLAIRQRIKLFFRPTGLVGEPAQAPEQLRWKWLADSDKLQVENPGPFHVSMVGISARQGGNQVLSKDSQMIAPGQTLQLVLNALAKDAELALSFISINDFGGQVPYHTRLLPGQSAQPVRTERR
jgi:chaperone protein EcpD